MQTVDIFYNTGFDIINVPCNPELLYDENQGFSHQKFEDFNLVQTDWLANVIIEDDRTDYHWFRDADYVVIEDTEKKTRTCYTVDHYEMLSDTTCKFYLVLDPLNTAGGFEPVDGHEPIVVLAGSANRLSVPLEPATQHQDFQQTEADTFFTLDEPFEPTQRLHMHYSAIPYTPYVPPTPPTPTPTPLDFRYPANNICISGQGFRRLTVGQDAGKFATTGDAGALSVSKEVSANRYQKIEVHSSGTGAFDFFETKSQFVEAMFNSAYAAMLRLKYQIEELPVQNQKFATDLTNAILPAIQGLFNDWKSTTPTNTNAEYTIQVTPQYVQNSQSHYLLQRDDASENPTEIGEVSSWGNPFSQTEGYWYRVRMKVACCTNNVEYYDVCEDGRIVKEA